MSVMTAQDLFERFRQGLVTRLVAESRRAAAFIERHMTAILSGWVILTVLFGGLKLALLFIQTSKPNTSVPKSSLLMTS